MSYEYVSKVKRDSGESARVLKSLLDSGLPVVAVRYKPETDSVVVYFQNELDSETKGRLDKLMSKLGYMVLA